MARTTNRLTVNTVRTIAHSPASVSERIRDLFNIANEAQCEIRDTNYLSDRASHSPYLNDVIVEAEVAIEELKEDGFCTEIPAPRSNGEV